MMDLPQSGNRHLRSQVFFFGLFGCLFNVVSAISFNQSASLASEPRFLTLIRHAARSAVINRNATSILNQTTAASNLTDLPCWFFHCNNQLLSPAPPEAATPAFATQSPAGTVAAIVGFRSQPRASTYPPPVGIIWPWIGIHFWLDYLQNDTRNGITVAKSNGTLPVLSATKPGHKVPEPPTSVLTQAKSAVPTTRSPETHLKIASTETVANSSEMFFTVNETFSSAKNIVNEVANVAPGKSLVLHFNRTLNATEIAGVLQFSKNYSTSDNRTSEMAHLTNKAELTLYSNATTYHPNVTEIVLVNRTNASAGQGCPTKVIGYYTSWGNRTVSRETLGYLTHVNYAFADLEDNGTVWLNPGSRDRLEHLLHLRGSKTVPKISMSVGGWGSSEKFIGIVRNESSFSLFLDGLLVLLYKYNLDGIDIDWEYPCADDRSLYVSFLKKIRSFLDLWKEVLHRDHLLLTFAGAAGFESLQAGFDITRLLEGETVDWVNVMTYDFYGPWDSPSGEYTGPISPLFSAAPQNYSRKLNTHWAIEQYVCKSSAPHKIMLGVPFYGRYWNNVGSPVDGDPMWRKVEGDTVSGGHENFNNINTEYVRDKNFKFYYSDTAKAAYAWSDAKKVYLGYESPHCADLKAQYAIQNGLGGVMIWAIDMDDDNLTLTKALTNGNMCSKRPSSLPKTPFVCREQRWWTLADNANYTGMCGKTAPIYNGAYAVCDPDDASASCCGQWGYCGGGPEYCDCPSCVDYGKFPDRIALDAVKPTMNETLWHTLESPDRGKCGYFASKVNNDTFAICNPDDAAAPCCSDTSVCGIGHDFCSCSDCVDFRQTPNFRYKVRPAVEKRWWTWADGEDKSGKCGPDAPRINGTEPICDPFSDSAHCCSEYGFCGSGDGFCRCPTCRDYSKLF